jgi:hypothetical protein
MGASSTRVRGKIKKLPVAYMPRNCETTIYIRYLREESATQQKLL